MPVQTPPSAPAEGTAGVSDAVRSREHGLSLLRRANRWLIGLAVVLAGGLTGLTAHAFHGSTASAQTTPTSSSQGSGDDGSGNSTSAPGVQPPGSPPSAASPAPASPAPAPPVVSGGS